MNVMEKISDLEKWLEDGSISRAVEAKRLGTAVTSAVASLRAADSRGGQYLERLELLASQAREANIGPEFDRDLLARTSEGLARAAASLDEGRADPARLESAAGEVKAVLKGSAEEFGKACGEAWRRRCEARFRESRNFADLVSRLGIQKDDAEKLRGAADQGLALGLQFPVSAQAIVAFDRVSEACRAARHKFADLDGSNELLGLAEKVAKGEATLLDVPPDLYANLAKHGVLSRFKVKLD